MSPVKALGERHVRSCQVALGGLIKVIFGTNKLKKVKMYAEKDNK